MTTEEMLRRIFGKRPRSLLEALRRGMVPPHYMAEAVKILQAYDANYVRKPKWAIPARSLYNDPGWDNVIRALEDDR